MEKMPDGTPIVWQCLFDEQAFTSEHCEMLNQSHRGALLEMVAELACCHPTAGVLLKNKWLTTPDKILSLVTCEYDKRTRETLHFWREQEAERWLHELSAAVLAPLHNVSQEHLDLAEQFILRLIDDQPRLQDVIGVGDGWSWHCELYAMLFRIILRNAENRPAYLRQRITEMLDDPMLDFSITDVEWRVNFPLDRELKAVLLAFID
ncbi:hypothetical protein QOM18_25655 [Serratia marcescens]|uniref:hypothetical protein n=1 Tax=Serratia marcescens TaxID=615 RepID=UPI0024C4D654|nr:hypothetical protein [Serratia marcescens]MDK1711710.1 hypothetical protein [Serratia marcescens]